MKEGEKTEAVAGRKFNTVHNTLSCRSFYTKDWAQSTIVPLELVN